VIFICGNEALSGLIERTLFDGGFEVIRVGGDAFDPSSASDVLSALWSAGFVILYSNSNFSADTRRLCETIAGGSFLHLSARDSEESALRRVLEFADALCARSELELN
jgi:hypothetical protein